MVESSKASPLDRVLRLFADVRSGEGRTALLLTLNCFLVLTAYYIVKPLRDGLVLQQYSPELKSYLQAANVLVLAVLVPLYGKLADRYPRNRLINYVTWGFAVCLVAFYFLGELGMRLGIVIYVYGSVFGVMIVAQFWSFANDIYEREEGERLFPIVAFGASVGGVLGATTVREMVGFVGIYVPMLLGAAVLVLAVQVTNYVDRRERRLREGTLPDVLTTASIAATGVFKAPESLEELEEAARLEKERYEAEERAKAAGQSVDSEPEKTGEAAFSLVLRTRFLLLISVLVLLLNWVNTNGGYILDRVVTDAAAEAVAAGVPAGMTEEEYAGEFIGGFFGGFYALQNLAALLIQLFLVSRIVKYAKVHRAILLLPLISLGANVIMAVMPLLAVVRYAKVAENSTDYSLNNTVRHMLFLPTTREQKYKGKQVTDSFAQRAGDVLQAVTVFLVVSVFAGGTTTLALLNVALVAIWLMIAVKIGREYRALVQTGRPPETRSAGSAGAVGDAVSA